MNGVEKTPPRLKPAFIPLARIELEEGSRPYCETVYSANQKLKPLFAVVNGKSEHHPEAVYHLRYLRDGKRVWEAVGRNAQGAHDRQHQRETIPVLR